ncbi:histidine phosphatase family protein [Alkalicoccobacillus porphyridii]|uniref:Histidine phosphatase family protein n=1 Tax=Alkalicoccobacillus porphyridii TaxID=2597270 RepID=A0A553ZWN6_9BACI|nr:histidine phosphatase family protein [Alkalicoccobacillus porphyridii]TSB45863.1 histidine phosphatase family protein [Alkalicoccobacillus porphyridii]
METYIYMIRHCESPKEGGSEKSRGLTRKGKTDASKLTKLLIDADIEVFISSPYTRAILSIEELANKIGKDILIYENFKECKFSQEDKVIPNEQVYPLVERMFLNHDYAILGGETYKQCMDRAIFELERVLSNFKGKKVAISTHGFVMTLMISFFIKNIGFDFLVETSKPDVYLLKFNGVKLTEFNRIRREV